MSNVTESIVKLHNPTDAHTSILISAIRRNLQVPPKGDSEPFSAIHVPSISHYITAFRLEVVEIKSEPVIEAQSVGPDSKTVSQLQSLVNENTSSTESSANEQKPADQSNESNDPNALNLDKIFTADELHGLYKGQLQQLAEHRKLSAEGNKADLIDRIFAAQSAE